MNGPSQHPDALLAAFVDGTLDPAERAEVVGHLAACDRCRGEVTLATRARVALGALPDVVAPPDLAGRIRSARTPGPSGDGGQRRDAGDPQGRSRSRSLPVAVAVAAAVAAILAVALPRLGGPDIPVTSAASVTSAALAPVAEEDLRLILATDRNYDPDAIRDEARAAAHDRASDAPAPSPAASGAAGTGPGEGDAPAAEVGEDATTREGGPGRTRTALRCLHQAFADFPGAPLRLILAGYEGTPAYIAAVLEPDGTVTVWVAAVDGCRILALSSVTP